MIEWHGNRTQTYELLLSTHSLDPCLWGESDYPASGPPASLSLHLASGGVSTNPGVTMWVLQRGNSGDGCDLASTLCKYDLRHGDCLF